MDMKTLFGNTPLAILILDAIGIALIPLLVAVFKRLGDISINLTDCVKSLTTANSSLATVIKELGDAKVRDTELRGHMKGMDQRLERLERLER